MNKKEPEILDNSFLDEDEELLQDQEFIDLLTDSLALEYEDEDDDEIAILNQMGY